MRIATWNLNSVTARLPRLLDWLGTVEPDVVCLQELKVGESAFPFDELDALGYAAAVNANGRWNGVAIASRVGIEDGRSGLPGEPGYLAEDALLPADERRAVAATCGGVRVWSVYVPNGREVGHPHFAYKLAWLDALVAVASAETAAAPERPFAVLGDFNIAPTDADVWDPAAFAGSTHVTADERARLDALRTAGLREVWPRALKYDTPYTYWDYRQLAFPKNNGMRIDLAFGNDTFVDGVTDAYVDREARKGKDPSDHAPVVIDVTLGDTSATP